MALQLPETEVVELNWSLISTQSADCWGCFVCSGGIQVGVPTEKTSGVTKYYIFLLGCHFLGPTSSFGQHDLSSIEVFRRFWKFHQRPVCLLPQCLDESQKRDWICLAKDLERSTGSSEPLQRAVKICRKTFDMCLIKSVCGRELFRIGCFTIFPMENNQTRGILPRFDPVFGWLFYIVLLCFKEVLCDLKMLGSFIMADACWYWICSKSGAWGRNGQL